MMVMVTLWTSCLVPGMKPCSVGMGRSASGGSVGGASYVLVGVALFVLVGVDHFH